MRERKAACFDREDSEEKSRSLGSARDDSGGGWTGGIHRSQKARGDGATVFALLRMTRLGGAGFMSEPFEAHDELKLHLKKLRTEGRPGLKPIFAAGFFREPEGSLPRLKLGGFHLSELAPPD